MPLPTNNPIAAALDARIALSPESVRFDSFTFQATIGAAVLTQPAANAQVHPDYKMVLTGMRGYFQQPLWLDTNAQYALGAASAFDPRNIALITFNLREPGRGWDFFNNSTGVDFPMSALVNLGGGAKDFEFPQPYIMPPNGTLQCQFQRAAGWLGTANVILGVVVYGYLVRPTS
jgi:hypothetical protein